MAELVAEGCRSVSDSVEVRLMSIFEPDTEYLRDAKAIIFGCPTYEASCSWQMKRYFDTAGSELEGKLAGFFSSQNWPGGGGATIAELMMIAAALALRGPQKIAYTGNGACSWAAPSLAKHWSCSNNEACEPPSRLRDPCGKTRGDATHRPLHRIGDAGTT